MVPSGPTTGPGVTAPSRYRCQRTAPAVGPANTEEPPCRASCNAAGHDAQLALAGAAAGGVNPAGDEIDGVAEPRGPLGPHPAATHATTATTTTAAAGLNTPGITTPTILAHSNGLNTRHRANHVGLTAQVDAAASARRVKPVTEYAHIREVVDYP
jgi:hypothetical protein